MSASFITQLDLSDGSAALAVVAKRTYRLLPGRRAEPLAVVPHVFDLPTTGGGELDPTRPLIAESDRLAPARPFTDVLVAGHVYAHGERVVDAAIEVGGARKVVRAYGERRVNIGGGGRAAFSPPLAFEASAISWEHAYGGRDHHAELAQALQAPGDAEDVGAALLKASAASAPVAYPRNPYGRGFFIDAERHRVAGTLAPSFEDPFDPVTPDRLFALDPIDWIDRPAAASFGPIDVFTFPRSAFLLPHAYRPARRAIYEVELGALRAEDLLRPPLGTIDPRLFNSAPVGLGSHRLHGGERARLLRLHPRHAVLDVELPADRPRLLIEPQNAGIRELEPRLQTVAFEPDDDQLTLTWTGTLRVAAPYPEELVHEMRHGVIWTVSARDMGARGGFP